MLQQDDLKNNVRATPIKSTRQEDKQQSEAKRPPTSGKSILEKTPRPSPFAVPDERRFSARFIPRVRPVGNLENIHPAGLLRPGTTLSDIKTPPLAKPPSSSPPPPSPPPQSTTKAEVVTEMSLSGKEADALFNSLFPSLGDSGNAVASPAQGPPAAATTSTTTTEKPPAPQTELPRRAAFRPRNNPRFRPARPFLTTPKESVESVTETTDDVQVNEERSSLFSLRNRFRGKNSFQRKIAGEAPSEVAVASPRPRQDPVTRRNNRFPFVPTPAPATSAAPPPVTAAGGEVRDGVESSSINEIPNATPRSIKKFFPRKSFRALIQSKTRNQLSSIAPKQNTEEPSSTSTTRITTTTATIGTTTTIITTTKPTTTTTTSKRITTTTTTASTTFSLNLIPTRADNQFSFFQSLVSPSTKSPTSTSPPPTRQTTQSLAPTRSSNVTPFTFFQSPFNSVFSQPSSSRAFPPVEPAFLNIPVNTQPPPATTATTSSAPIFVQQQPGPVFSARARGSAAAPAPATTQQPLVHKISFGRVSPTSAAIEEDPEHQRMMTQRARVQIKHFLPRAENEGDAIEKLRAKVESFQNRNRARG